MLKSGRRVVATIEPDSKWPGMWRVRCAGSIGEANLSRAKDATISPCRISMRWVDAARLQNGRTAASTAKLPDQWRGSTRPSNCSSITAKGWASVYDQIIDAEYKGVEADHDSKRSARLTRIAAKKIAS
jgi:hypothetical protein